MLQQFSLSVRLMQSNSTTLINNYTCLVDIWGDMYSVLSSQEISFSLGLSFFLKPSSLIGVFRSSSSSRNNSSSFGSRGIFSPLGGLVNGEIPSIIRKQLKIRRTHDEGWEKLTCTHSYQEGQADQSLAEGLAEASNFSPTK